MTSIIKVDAQGKRELMEEIGRYNAERRRIEDESCARTGRPPIGPAAQMIALPIKAAKTEPASQG